MATKFKFRDASSEPLMALTAPPENNIVLYSGGSEMLRIAQDGFYVRGVRVPQDDREAAAVYECFKEWLTWSQLNR